MKSYLGALAGALLAGTLIGCDGAKTSLQTTKTTAIVSGKVVLAHDGSGLGGATIRLRTGGKWYTTKSAGGNSFKTGDFVISDLPINATFYIEIDPRQAGLATSYTFGDTNTTDSGENIDGAQDEFNSSTASDDIGIIHIYNEATTTITVTDVADGSAISGLGMWVEAESMATGDTKTGSISAPHIPATEDTTNAPGVYTFALPDHGTSIGVYVNNLTTDGDVTYQTLTGDLLERGGFDNGTAGDNGGHDESQFTDRMLTSIVPGQDVDIALRQANAYTLTVSFELFDDDGAAYSGAGTAIAVTETSTGNVISAVQDATQSNLYTVTTDFRNNLTYQVMGLDLDGDTFADTAATIVHTGSVVQNGQTAVTIPVTISDLTSSSDVLAEVLTSTMVPGQAAVATIAFNQPVSPVGSTPVLITLNALDLNAAADGGDDISIIGGTVVNSTGAASGAPVLTNDPDGDNQSEFSYTDNVPTADVRFVVPGGDVNGDVADPHETRVDSTNSIISAATLTATNAGNTIYELTITDPSVIVDGQQVSFSMLVKADGSDVAQVVSSSVFADITAAATLSDITIDDGDFIDTTSRDIAAALSPLIVAENGDIEYPLTNTDGIGTCGASNCLFRAIAQPGAQAVGATEGALSLVAPRAFYGTVKLVSYVVTSLPGGASADVDTTTTVFDTQITVSSTADEAAMLSDAADTDDNDLTDLRGDFEYFLADPENQDLDDKSGDALGDVYGSPAGSDTVAFNNNWTRGYDYSGLGFRVDLDLAGTNPLGLPSNTASSFLSSVTLDIDVVMAGQRQTGQVTLSVR